MDRLKTVFIFLLFFVLMVNNNSVSAYPNYSFKHYNINNGLSQNTIRSIFQDNQGFMWFGTKDGLNRFDGSTFKVFKFSPNDNLNDNVFHRILQDKNNNIWVSTEEGVYIYDLRKEQFHRFNRLTSENDSVNGVVTDMVADRDGDIWMSVEGKGIYQYNFADDELIFFATPIVKDGMKMVSLCSDNNSGVWVFPYSSPFIHINKKTKEITRYNLSDNQFLMNQVGEVSDVFLDQYNILLLATSQKGLIAINTVNKTHRVILDKDEHGDAIFVRCIERIDPNTLWIGTESGVFIYNSEAEEVINLKHDNLVPGSLSDNAIYSIYKDREGGIWVGSYFGGVDYYSNQNNNFELFYPSIAGNSIKGNRVREFCAAPNGKIWIGTEDGGLNLFDPVTGDFEPLPQALRTLYTNIHALYDDGDYLWIGAFTRGLSRYNLKTGELVTYTHSVDPHSISQNSTFALCKDKQGMLWVGTLAGVDIFDEKNNQFNRVEKLKGMSILDIYEDSHGFIWISTFLNGLYQFNPSTKEWKVFIHNTKDAESLPYNKTTSIYEDSKRRLWVTTQGGGFGLFDRDKETFLTFNSTDGLSNDVVYQIVAEDDGTLWLSTNSGLVVFDIDKKTFKNFTVNNGLKTNQFNYKSSYKDRNGNIYFGSLMGFVRFNPSLFKETTSTAPLIITDLFVNNLRINPTDNKSPLKQSIMYTDKVSLPYKQNSLSVRFARLNYSGADMDQLFYMLKGFDDRWIAASENNPIVYSNLKPGNYELIFGVADEDPNVPVRSIKSLSIKIKPPYWLNGWAFLIYFLLIVTGTYLLTQYISGRNKLNEQVRMRDFEQQKERELYQSKINFFTNLTHEIRTPLTLIKAPLDHVLMADDIPDSAKENLQIMSKNTSRLLNLTKQLLDFRKTESEAYLISLKTQNVTELIRETILRFTPLAKQKNIIFEIDLPSSDMFVQLDKEAFLKIISNLLSNAIKYCDHYVRLQANIKENNIREFHLITENDGELIPPIFEDKIFRPFVQIEGKHDNNVSGTGIGLALASSLADLHGGSLRLENYAEYNRFHLILPVGNVQTNEDKTLELENKEIQIQKNEDTQRKETTILLVDDDVELLQFEAKFLSERYNVIVAKNGLEALDQLKKLSVNLIVTDVMMPEMDGFAFTEKVKSDIEYSHIPVILLTAKVMAQAKVQGYELGADAYLEKPFSVEVLLARINNLLQNREKLRETFLKHPFIGINTVALTKSDEAFIIKLNEVINDNLSDSDFNVEDMAERFNMSRASFYRKVKGVLDLTPNEYIRVERLKKAAQLLKQDEHKINEICYMVGFNSPSYFAKCFYQQFGILPKDFQEQK